MASPTLLLKDGRLLANGSGQLISDTYCCCPEPGERCGAGECLEDGQPTGEMKIRFTFCGRSTTFTSPSGGGTGCCRQIFGTNQPEGSYVLSSLFQLCGMFGGPGLGFTDVRICCESYTDPETEEVHYNWSWLVGVFADRTDDPGGSPFPGISRSITPIFGIDGDDGGRFTVTVESGTFPIHYTLRATLDSIFDNVDFPTSPDSDEGFALCSDCTGADRDITIEFFEEA